jgi:hypothetical protein
MFVRSARDLDIAGTILTKSASVGLLIMIVSELATVARIEPFWSWNTPIAWCGFILFADSIVFRARGESWIRSAPREFFWLALASIPLWLVFEFYNRFIQNWHYVGLPENPLLRYFGYAWAFATIWPAIFEGAELIGVWRGSRRLPPGPMPGSPSGSRASRTAGNSSVGARISIGLGAALLLLPIGRPSPYLASPVFLGFIFLLDPINMRLGGESLAHDFHAGQFDRFKNLMLSGLSCGILWEFWNYWARSKWHYTVPVLEHLKIFEMPVLGYFGFPAFALECFTMYVFMRIAARNIGSVFQPFVRLSSMPGLRRGASEAALPPATDRFGRRIAL